MEKKVSKIVLTGGPCAGKTTGMSWIVNYFTKRGYKVLIVAETPTELITGGACPWEQKKGLDFQLPNYYMQKAKEKAYKDLASTLEVEKVLIVCDRGAMDAEAYLTEEGKIEFHEKTGKSATQMMEDYDAVFHLVTAAKGAKEFYTTENNEARKESPELAAELDDKTIAAWTGHPHLRVIDNSTDFEKKMQRLVMEIASFLGEPEPFEIERKFLIEYPDIDFLNSLPNCQQVEIIQTYLKCSKEGEESRIRQRGDGKTFSFTRTTKRTISNLKRVELEKRLSMEEYCMELMNADTNLHQIRKTRYCLAYGPAYYEIDVYPFWKDKAILEVELTDEEDELKIPEFLKVIKEVTDDDAYKNRNLARR